MVATLETLPDTRELDPATLALLGAQGRLAIVGSVSFVDPLAWHRAEEIIREEIEYYKPQICLSGGEPKGIDTFFKNIAGTYGYRIDNKTFEEYLPRNLRWTPAGFKERNILVAKRCTRCVAIRCHASKTYGSGWTVDYAEKLGKSVRREIL